MSDEADKIKLVPRDEQADLSDIDPPDTDPPEEDRGQIINAFIKDIGGLSKQLDTKSAEITPQFISTATREEINTKRLEYETLFSLYTSKIAEIKKEPMLKITEDSVKENETAQNERDKRIKQMLATSKFAIASTLKKTITGVYNRLKDIRESVTVDYLHESTKEVLEEKRSQIASLYGDFIHKYESIHTENLEDEEKHELITQKVYAETAATNVDKFIVNELNAREKVKNPSEAPKELPQTTTASASKNALNHTNQLTELQEQLQQVIFQAQKEKNEADERIKSLELKFSNSQHGMDNDQEQSDPPTVEEAGPLVTVVNPGLTGLKPGQITLPTFSGNLEDWEAFKALYETVIHSSKMSKTIKFNQLRTLLKGQALDAIRGFQITGTNYDAAWELLKKRYDRTGELVEEYIRKFFETKPLEPRSNFVAVRKIIDYTNQMLRALPTLGANINNWDPIVNLIICSKLNEDIRSEWQKRKVKKTTTETSELLEFLEDRAIELQPSQSEKFSEMLKGDTRKKFSPKKVFQTNESSTEPKKKNKNECLMCKGNHSLWDCSMLKSKTAKVRTGIIKALGLCFKCLLKHAADLCENEDCEYCGGPHHILLCYKRENEDKMQPFKKSSSLQPRPGTSNQLNYDSNNDEKTLVKKKLQN